MHTIPAAIARHYRSKSLLLDVLSSIPIDRIVVALVSRGTALRSLRMLRIVSLFRLLKLFRILKFSKFLVKLEQKLEFSPQVLQVGSLATIPVVFEMSTSLAPALVTAVVLDCPRLQIARLAIQVMFATHFVGCFFFWASSFDDSGSHWYYSKSSHISDSLSAHYVAAVYWAMTTVRSHG